MLKDETIIPIQSPYASPLVLCRKNNGLPPDNLEEYRFAVDYRKLYSITKYPRYPLSLIDDLITNIPHTTNMSSLGLKSGYFQLTVSPSYVVKTVFDTENGAYAFRRTPFRLSGVAPNFQKVIDMVLKPVIGSKIISDNGPQFIFDIFEHLSDILDISYVRTVVYRPQANGTECVNHDLVQMIANYGNDQHDTWDQFLREFAYAIRTAVNETTGKTPTELFLGR
ncbi:retrovirus-related Pol polyprotein from transposon 17.6 [Trichonephila clavipes]|nr:retrovirus-related Pol polyprotein from transposon 17.6 [Trichonephila clavipes]